MRRDIRDMKREYENNSNNSQLLTTLLLVYLKNIFARNSSIYAYLNNIRSITGYGLQRSLEFFYIFISYKSSEIIRAEMSFM